MAADIHSPQVPHLREPFRCIERLKVFRKTTEQARLVQIYGILFH